VASQVIGPEGVYDQEYRFHGLFTIPDLCHLFNNVFQRE
jgi:hypothetical protein